MKKALLVLCFFVLFVIAGFLYRPEKQIPYAQISVVSEETLSELQSERRITLPSVLDVMDEDFAVPLLDIEETTWCIPLLTDDVVFRLPKRYSLVRTESSGKTQDRRLHLQETLYLKTWSRFAV